MPNINVTNFNAGELTEYVDARGDTEKYASGCKVLENMLPLVHGPVTRRPGTKYIATAKNSTGNVRMIPFIYSSEIAYMCEFGDKYIRFFYDGESVASEIESPYSAADLPCLQYRQVADTMWITHSAYAPRKLTRTSVTSFSLDEIVFTRGPFLTRNDLLNPDDDNPTTITHTSSDEDYYKTNDDGAYDTYGTIWRAQTFTASSNYTLRSVSLLMYRVGSPGACTVHIRACTTNDPATAKPTGDDLAVGYTSGNTLTTATTGEWREVMLNSLVPIVSGTMYAILVSSAASKIYWRTDASSPTYTGGCVQSSTDSGATWTLATGADFMFATLSVENNLLTASADTFVSGHEGALFKLTYPRTSTISEGSLAVTGELCAPIDVKGSFSFVTHGTWDGTLLLQRSENGEDWDNYRTYRSRTGNNVSLAETEDSDNVRYRAEISSIASGTVFAEITVNNGTQDAIFRVHSVTDPTTASVEFVSGLPSTAATRRWAEGAWSGKNGYPCAIAFFEDRAIYGGGITSQQTIWLSETGDYENFEEGVLDADSFSLVLTTTNAIRWIESLESLLIGTSGDEWVVSSTKLNTPLTPTNFSARQRATFGSCLIQPTKVHQSVLFVDYVSRKIREMTYMIADDKYAAPDLTILAEHVTEGDVIAVAYQKSPESILWCALGDGSLISLTYERDQNVTAWSRHPMQTGSLVKSVAVMPGDEEDEVWLVVSRSINGSDVQYVERFEPRRYDDQEDAYFVDCGIIYDGTATDTITDLDHLEGETVSVLGDGAVFPDKVVSGGQITLSSAVSKAAVGLPYRYKLQPMRINMDSQRGSHRGSIKKISELVISFLDTLGAQYGVDADNLFDISWRTTEAYGEPPSLFTGDKVVVLDGGFDPEIPIMISGAEPLPATVRCIVARAETTGR